MKSGSLRGSAWAGLPILRLCGAEPKPGSVLGTYLPKSFLWIMLRYDAGMKMLILTALCLGSSLGQRGHGNAGTHSATAASPPSQAEIAAIVRKDYQKNVADVGTILQLAAQLKTDIENQSTQTVSATTVKEAEQIEKLAHGIRNRLKH